MRDSRITPLSGQDPEPLCSRHKIPNRCALGTGPESRCSRDRSRTGAGLKGGRYLWGFDDDGWENAKRIYGVNGMPAPSVQIEISEVAELKMNYLRSYSERERKTIGFFIPAFEDYEAKEYFTLFDREFFQVIAIK